MIEEAFLKSCVSHVGPFKERVLPLGFFEHGILTSEGFAFCVMCELYGVNVILESGVCMGRSTMIWAKYFGRKVKIVGVDHKPFDPDVRHSLKKMGVKLIVADSLEQFPILLERYVGCRVAVFIDGPKDANSIRLAKKCYKRSNVKFVGVHDVHKWNFDQHKLDRGEKDNIARVLFDRWDVPKFLTENEEFLQRYSELDEVYKRRKRFWTPYKYRGEEPGESFGSYGFTVGFAVKPKELIC